MKNDSPTDPMTAGETPGGQNLPKVSVSHPLAVVFRRVLAAWAVGCLVTALIVCFTDKSLFGPALLISLASGLIAIAAVYAVLQFSRNASGLSNVSGLSEGGSSTDLVSSFMVATMVRLFGTVALFLWCRYQMGQPPVAIAALVSVWYVWLTCVEVVSLAKTTADLQRSRTNRQIWTTG